MADSNNSCASKSVLTILNVVLLAIGIACIAVGGYGFGTGWWEQSNLALATCK
jgi:hypothetical protein